MTILLKDDNGNELPQEVQDRVNAFIDNLKNVPWFSPSPDLKKADVEAQAKFTLKCFGIEAEIEYKKITKKEDWNYACESVWSSDWTSDWASSWTSAWTSVEILLEDNEEFKKKYPNGAFKQLFKLWEMGLYPV